MPCPTLLPFVAHKCPSIHALLVRNGYVDEYVDHGNRSAWGGKWELQKSAVHHNLVSFYASKVSLVSISVWVNSDISRNLPAIPWKTGIWFHFERIPLRISNALFAMRSLWSTSLNIIVPTNMPSAFWMVVKKPLEWRNLDTSHSPSWNWKNHLRKSIFQTDIMQLHGRTFPKYKWLESYVRLVWLDILRCQGHLPNFHCFPSDMTHRWKRFSAFTLVFVNKKIRVAVEQHDANEGR